MFTVIKFWKTLFIPARFFVLMGLIVSLFLFSFFFPELFAIAKMSLLILVALTLADFVFLWLPGMRLLIKREMPPKLSNGDDNVVSIYVRNHYSFPVRLIVYDELPEQLQIRDLRFRRRIASGEETTISYNVKPVLRGEYHFGDVQVLALSPLGLAMKRHSKAAAQTIPCYPSFLQLRRYELMAVSNRYEETGQRRIQSVGRSYEFDHIRNYVLGDDIRSINWKASARRDTLMMNQFRDEKAQQIYCVIDAGRTMKSPFDGMTLLDYAINATLVLSDVAIVKNDKAGLMMFSKGIHSLLPCENRRSQVGHIMENLYNAETDFSESSFELMTATLIRKVPRRSLIVLFTNFEGRVSLQRQLPFLKQLARRHLLLTVFFENSMLSELAKQKSRGLSDVYLKAIAEKQLFERKFIAEDLQRAGVMPLLTSPSRLTIDAVNRYIDIKVRKLI